MLYVFFFNLFFGGDFFVLLFVFLIVFLGLLIYTLRGRGSPSENKRIIGGKSCVSVTLLGTFSFQPLPHFLPSSSHRFQSIKAPTSSFVMLPKQPQRVRVKLSHNLDAANFAPPYLNKHKYFYVSLPLLCQTIHIKTRFRGCFDKLWKEKLY